MSTTDLAQQVADLTTATTQLTQEVVGQKARLTAAADTATSKASDASGSASAASASATSANAAAAAAETSKNQASEISGLDTVEEAVDLALAARYLGARTKSDLNVMRQQNNDKYAASGFVHPGKLSGNAVSILGHVNQGITTIWANSNYANRFYLGKAGFTQTTTGSSKTDNAVTNIAGVISEILMGEGLYGKNAVKLPEAPDGTVVYDSSGDCRGTGKPNLDLSKEVDPKYGDIASSHNEAVARAFEGMVKNGDMREGENYWNKYNSDSTLSVTNGILRSTGSSGWNGVSAASVGVVSDTEYQIDFLLHENTTQEVIYVTCGGTQTAVDVRHNVYGEAPEAISLIVTAGPSSSQVFRVHQQSAANIAISNVSVKPITEEVVTERVDLVGLEFYLEEVTQTNPFVYPNGCIQSQLPTMNGIPTTRSNRPDTYYAVYDGDVSSAGKGVDFWAATEEQKVSMLSDASNNLFNFGDDLVPKIVQWRVRQRSIAGAGNGDWFNTNSVTGNLLFSTDSPRMYTHIQGIKDSIPSSIGTNWSNHGYYSYTGDTQLVKPDGTTTSEQGVFVATKDGSSSGGWDLSNEFAYNGECYFYTVATVPRLNQGAYHPSLNPLGCGRWSRDSDGDGDVNQMCQWYDDTPHTTSIKTKKAAFIRLVYNQVTSDQGRYRDTGSIISNTSGRPDGKFYDAIYASGLGGVIDHRPKYGAWDASRPEQAAEVFQEVVSGQYRGVEKLKFSIPSSEPATSGNYNNKQIQYTNATKLHEKLFEIFGEGSQGINNGSSAPGDSKGNYGYFLAKDGTTTYPILGLVVTGDSVFLTTTTDGYQEYRNDFTTDIPLVVTGDTDISVSGEFTQMDVIGDPAQILATPQLKNGWVGSWIPVIPDGVVDSVPLSRKVSGASSTRRTTYTDNNGSSWSIYSPTIAAGNNSHNTVHPAGRIAIYNYQAFAKQTKQGGNHKIFNARSGLLPVISSAYYEADYGTLLSESTLGKILVATNAEVVTKSFSITDTVITPDGKLTSINSRYSPNHSTIDMGAPNNSNVGFKVLPHQVEDNHQASLNFIANELKHNGTDWGDDNTMKVIENGTYTNLNGEVCLANIHELAIPYGYVKH